MKILYLQCGMGAAGDMLSAALLELVPEPEKFVERLNALKIPKVKYSALSQEKCGIRGTRLRVEIDGVEESPAHSHHHELHHHPDGDPTTDCHHQHDDEPHHDHAHHHEHHDLATVAATINSLDLPAAVKSHAIAVYNLIAEAESVAHGCPVSEVHFHEVGAADAIADVVAVSLLLNEIAPDKIVASPVCVGFGSVCCAHGILPVPAPATALILRGVPVYAGEIRGELCTPTGAALLKHFVSEFCEMPPMTLLKIGHGLGSKDFPAANCVCSILGNSDEEKPATDPRNEVATDCVAELSCNIDDMTGEQIAFATEKIFAAGALDVWTTPIGMKKNRPGVAISCMCSKEKRTAVALAMFKYTTTLGMRVRMTERFVLARRETTVVASKFGDIRVKEAAGFGISKSKPEFDDLRKIANDNNISPLDIKI
ncbi:MAG: nickel pincer cofactor biosynthesis protein LarC [Opitutae bacterium]|nr:nickel pincer cofactor biosynthesis protein LarC [Opitutae bacterium]